MLDLLSSKPDLTRVPHNYVLILSEEYAVNMPKIIGSRS
jgi:hypothetical protein